MQLADQRRLRRLARLDLAARKFPEPGHRLARRSPRQQHAAVGIDERDGRDEHHAQGCLRAQGLAQLR
jgi:hypothetical protein